MTSLHSHLRDAGWCGWKLGFFPFHGAFSPLVQLRFHYMAAGAREQAFHCCSSPVVWPGRWLAAFSPCSVGQQQESGPAEGPLQRSLWKGQTVVTVFRNIVLSSTPCPGELEPHPGPCQSESEKTVRWGALREVPRARSSAPSGCFWPVRPRIQGARPLPLFWAIPIREIENNLSAFFFFSWNTVLSL